MADNGKTGSSNDPGFFMSGNLALQKL